MSAAGSDPVQREAAANRESLSSGPLADAAALGLSTLAQVLTMADNGIGVIDSEARWVYANPAACQLLAHPFGQLRGQDFMGTIEASAHASLPSALTDQREHPAEPFTFSLPAADGSIREIRCSTFAIAIMELPHRVVIFNDLTGPATAARTAVALAQTAAQLVGAGTTEEILIGLARHGVEGTRALAIGTVIVGDDLKLVTAGGYGFPDQLQSRQAWTSASITFDDLPGWDALAASGTVVVPDARDGWEASVVLAPFAATLAALDWQGAVYVPMSWGNQLIGNFGVYLPSGLLAPSEEELAFYTALADQSAVAVTNARLAASVERTRLARELHDSVSQALFSMTMHARAAQLSMIKAGLDEHTPTARAIAQLVDLTAGAMAEMRALIFELRPEALLEEGLIGALRKQAAALTAREQVKITVQGPEQRLELPANVEEHLYRIVSEALHNLVKHAEADEATVRVHAAAGTINVVISDNGVGFDPQVEHAGHLGLANMSERAAVIGANLRITSAPTAGTTVTLSLPYTPGRPATSPTATS
ncbi:MAG: histidine kinase [Actinomycetota bacterium]|nr:histidine kinase [Actinomycetota bacterium]